MIMPSRTKATVSQFCATRTSKSTGLSCVSNSKAKRQDVAAPDQGPSRRQDCQGACQDLPGQELFQYLDENGERRDVTSADVNAYLREITGRDVTPKDFRTWAGTVLAALALQEFEIFDTQAKVKKNVRAAIERVAARLGNTPTICRKCYIHPEILSLYAEGALLSKPRIGSKVSCARIWRH
jgi:Eukaryotic DNA topoisomerase I, catalytic core